MGQQYSSLGNSGDGAAGSSSSQNAGGERKAAENGDLRLTSSAWRNTATVAGPQGHSELGTGDQVLRQRTDMEVNRMSIRAAIDTFIENCLSTATDDKTADDSHLRTAVISIDSAEKTVYVSSNSRNSDTSAGGSCGVSSESKSADSGNINKNHFRDVETQGNDAEDKDIIIDCDEKVTAENKTLKVKDGYQVSDGFSPHSDKPKEELSENSDEKLNSRDSSKGNASETSSGTQEKQEKASVSSEKQSFSAFLHGRLKNEKLAELAFGKDISCDRQMDGHIFMWEVPKKPTASSDSADASDAPVGSSLLTMGPVRLQTLIDKVLDNSLNNHALSSTISHKQQTEKTVAPQKVLDGSQPQSSVSEGSPREQLEQSLVTTEDSSNQKEEKRFCFKDHIEKVLLESFLSYEEEERKEALKTEADSRRASTESLDGLKAKSDGVNRIKTETDMDKINSKKDGTISVQDIVDQVISQTEMISRLLTPSARDVKTASASLSGHSSGIAPSTGSPPQDNSGLKYSISSHSRALLEAQKHTVQKEHQSSTALGRKRGRPQLSSMTSLSNCPADPAKEFKSAFYNDRLQDLKGSQSSSRMNDLSQMRPLPLNCASQSSLQYGNQASITSMISQVQAPSVTVMYQHGHHVTHKSPETTSTVRPSATYQVFSHDGFHQQFRGQQLSSQVHQHPHCTQLNSGSQKFSSPTPPPHAVAEHVKENLSSTGFNGRLVPISHIPTKSCSCHSCFSHLSQGTPVSQSTHLQQHMHHHHHHHDLPEQDRVCDPSVHPSGHPTTSSHRNGRDLKPDPLSLNSEALVSVLAVPVPELLSQTLAPAFVVSQAPRLTPPSREITLNRQMDSEGKNPCTRHYQAYQSPGVVKPAFPDIKVYDTRSETTKHGVQFDCLGTDEESCSRAPDELKLGAITHETEQPLDLSVKPNIAQSRDARASFSYRVELARPDSEFLDKERQASSDRSARAKGQYVENDQQGLGGHHLQQLENSVDKFLLYGHLPASHYTQHAYFPQQGQKISPLSTQNMPRVDGRGELLHEHADHPQMARQSQSMKSGHGLLQSSVVHTQPPLVSSQQQQQQQQRQQLRIMAQSPSSGSYQSRSPGLILNHGILKTSDLSQHIMPFQSSESLPHPAGTVSPAGYEPSPNVGPDQKNRATPGITKSGVSTQGHSQDSSSPEDQDGQKFSVSRHEPIQNIIGSHPPSDILYLICRLCRQTYGSPYGFRKHFRNQHGFEPKASHTIVQTISATKTAMAHTGPLDSLDESLLPQSPKDERPLYDDVYSHGPSLKSQPASDGPSAPSVTEDTKSDVKKEVSENTKCLECPECGQTFQLNDFGSYKRHCRQHGHHRSSGPFVCHECQRSFPEADILKEHLLTHSSFSPSLCGICHTFFSSPNYLAEHFQAAHGHVYSTEGGERASAHADGRENSRSADYIQKPKHLTNEIKRSSSFCGQSVAVSSAVEQRVTAVAPEHSTAHSSANHKLSDSKCNSNLPSGDAHMFIIHTPKGLAIEKQPADAVVTTASPDSSYDEAKFQVDSQPGNSMGEKVTKPAEIQVSGRTDTTTGSKTEEDNNVASYKTKMGKVIGGVSKNTESLEEIKLISKGDTESNSSEASLSTDSNSLPMSGSHAASGDNGTDTFYRHKKYGQSKKRVISSDIGNEPKTKSQRVEGSATAHRQSPYSVSSTGVTLQDCESSCSHSEDSRMSWNKSKAEENNKDEEKLSHKTRISSKGDAMENLTNGGTGGYRGATVGDTGMKFKWDRQTRSQTSRTSQNVTNMS